MSVRRASRDDWRQLWPLLRGMGTTESEDLVRERFVRMADVESWLIVTYEAESDRLLGYAAAQDYGDHLRAGRRGRIARLHDLFVVPDNRRRGVGSALLGSVVDWASTRVANLQWQAREGDATAFYEHLGYKGEPCPQPDYPEFEISFR